MKEIYKDILEALKDVAQLKWVDLEKGQMNSSKPTVAFPAALISIYLPKTNNITKEKQNVDCQITVRLCFNFTGSTNSKMTTAERDKSLAYFEIADAVFNALQGYETENMNSLERINAVEEVRPDDYKVLQQSYRTSYIEAKV